MAGLSGTESFIFMKLGNTKDNEQNRLNGHEVIQEYMADEKKRGYTWFTTSALRFGMSSRRVKQYKYAIQANEKVTLLFAIGKGAGGTNEIAYRAKVLDIKSYGSPTQLDINDYPSRWHGEKATIWIKIRDVQIEDTLKVSLFKVTSTGTDLRKVINNSQCVFPYVSYK
jgi:hypothetical protein